MTILQLLGLIAIICLFAVCVAISLSRRPLPDINSDDDVLRLLKDGKRIDAIKAYRQLHKCDLKAAKQFLDCCDKAH